jgi:hypothetical protein
MDRMMASQNHDSFNWPIIEDLHVVFNKERMNKEYKGTIQSLEIKD